MTRQIEAAPEIKVQGPELREDLSTTYCTIETEDCQMLNGEEEGVFEDEFYSRLGNNDVNARLEPDHLEDLRSSGLDNKTILAANIVTISPQAASEYLGYDPLVPCIAFPYPHLRGDAFYRFKPSRPLVYGNGEVRKYLAKKNGGNRLYVPPYDDLQDVFVDTERDLIVTEGEKKVLMAYQEGFTAVAFSGVWNWKEKSNSGTGQSDVIPELDGFRWLNRTVYIVFDSDAVENESVQKAEMELAKELCSRGANVLIARLPSEGGEKIGLDDYLVQTGKEAFNKVLQDSAPPPDIFFDGKTFIPSRLANHLKQSYTFCNGFDPKTGAGRLMKYQDGVWQWVIDSEIKTSSLLGEASRKNRVEETITHLEWMADRLEWERWNSDKLLINCRDGMLDPRTKEIKEHAPEYYSTIQVDVEYDPDANDPVVMDFLKDVLPEDAHDMVFEMIGYLLVPSQSANKFFVLEGPAGTGKTTFLGAVENLIGSKNWVEITLQKLAEDDFASARLENKLLAFYDDLDERALKSASKIKALTGGHPWHIVERKFKDAYDAPLYAKLFFACNSVPSSPDKSQAWLDRLTIIPFESRFRGEKEEDPDMTAKLTTESARKTLFRYATEGLKRLIENGWRFSRSKSVEEALEEYRRKNDTLAAFIKEECELGLENYVSRKQLYESYRNYCEQIGQYSVSRRKVYRRLREDHDVKDDKDEEGNRFFRGIHLDGSK